MRIRSATSGFPEVLRCHLRNRRPRRIESRVEYVMKFFSPTDDDGHRIEGEKFRLLGFDAQGRLILGSNFAGKEYHISLTAIQSVRRIREQGFYAKW